jgi:hypothetical protein
MPHPKLIVATAGMMMIDDDNVDGGIIRLIRPPNPQYVVRSSI